jgi:hypothetical protein
VGLPEKAVPVNPMTGTLVLTVLFEIEAHELGMLSIARSSQSEGRKERGLSTVSGKFEMRTIVSTSEMLVIYNPIFRGNRDYR